MITKWKIKKNNKGQVQFQTLQKAMEAVRKAKTRRMTFPPNMGKGIHLVNESRKLFAVFALNIFPSRNVIEKKCKSSRFHFINYHVTYYYFEPILPYISLHNFQ